MRQKILTIVCMLLFVISVTGAAPALAARSFGAAKPNTATTQPTKHKHNRKKHKKQKRRHKHHRRHRKHHGKKKPTTKPTAAPSGASVARP